jgi:hypothetical protein
MISISDQWWNKREREGERERERERGEREGRERGERELIVCQLQSCAYLEVLDSSIIE